MGIRGVAWPLTTIVYTHPADEEFPLAQAEPPSHVEYILEHKEGFGDGKETEDQPRSKSRERGGNRAGFKRRGSVLEGDL